MSPSSREKRIRRIMEHGEFYTVISEHGGYLKVCVRKKNKRGKIGTFARVALGTKLSDYEMRVLVRKSVEGGVVLNISASAAVLLACALETHQPIIGKAMTGMEMSNQYLSRPRQSGKNSLTDPSLGILKLDE